MCVHMRFVFVYVVKRGKKRRVRYNMPHMLAIKFYLIIKSTFFRNGQRVIKFELKRHHNLKYVQIFVCSFVIEFRTDQRFVTCVETPVLPRSRFYFVKITPLQCRPTYHMCIIIVVFFTLTIVLDRIRFFGVFYKEFM